MESLLDLGHVAAALLGSLLTVIATKIFDLVQSARQHGFELRQIYFRRKLEVAEQAAAEVNRVAFALRTLPAILDGVSDDAMHDAVSKAAWDSLQRELTRIEEQTEMSSSALPLYFDFSVEESLTLELLQDYWRATSELRTWATRMERLRARRRASDDPADRQIAGAQLYKAEEAFRELVRGYSAAMDSMATALGHVLKRLRSELAHLDE